MTAPRRVVARAPNWLGDVLMAVPALRAVQAAWPAAVVDVALPAAFAPLVPMMGGFGAAVPLGGKGLRGLAAQRGDAERLRAGGYDVGVLFTNSFGSAWVLRRAGVPERWGYRRDLRAALLTRAVPPRQARRTSPHHADYYAALVEALGLPVRRLGEPSGDLTAQITVPDNVSAEADALLAAAGWDGRSPLLACAPGAAYGTAKQYPPAMAAEVVARWVAERDGTVAIVGAAADAPAAHEVIARARLTLTAAAGARLVDLTAGTSLAQLAAVLARADRVLANDSGAMHLAAAVGTPVVTVFGATNEHATAPLGPHHILTADVWCRPCLLRECPLDHRCMTRVPATRVFDALQG